MVGAINAPATGNHTFAAFQALAKSNSGPSGVRHICFFIYFLTWLFLQQGVGNLVGVGASASVIPGPLESAVTLFGTPSSGASAATGTAFSGSSASGSAATGATSGTGTAIGSESGRLHSDQSRDHEAPEDSDVDVCMIWYYRHIV